MRIRGKLITLFTLAASLAVPALLQAEYRVTGLKCEYGVDPMGVDTPQPRLFWRIESDRRDQYQSAWQVLVATRPELLEPGRADLWDSGKVDTSQTTHVVYEGKAPGSSRQVFWTVRSWDREGKPGEWAPAATWTMGKLSVDDWQGQWIQAADEPESILVRKEFEVPGGVKRALLHISGLGHYELFINGRRIGEDLLTPGWTNYEKTALYDTIDITDALTEGDNAIGVHLGNGMLRVDRRDRFSKFNGSFGKKRLIADLVLEFEDGSRKVIATDSSWKSHVGPITFSNIYGGEDYDARLLPEGWAQAGLDESGWTPVERMPGYSRDVLKGYTAAANPIRVIEVRQPVEVIPLGSPGGATYDLGQNTSYMPRLTVTGPRGSRVVITPGELIYPDGYITRSSMGGIHRGFSWMQYTKGTDGPETWTPSFFYIGSRYFQTQTFAPEGGGERAVIQSMEGLITHSTAAPVGDFKDSNPLMEDIRMLVRWAQRSNMVSVLTDCPHREKLGWLEQYHLNGPAIRYEFDVNRIYTKSMIDMADAQTGDGLVPNIAPEFTEFRGTFRAAAEWGAAFIMVPWQQYLFAGDVRLIEQHWDEMKRYYAYLEGKAEDDILSEGLGDWYDLGPRTLGRSELTLPPVTATAYFYYDALILSRMAAIIGEDADAAHYAGRAARIRKRFNEEFYNADGGYYAENSQAANAIPLVMGIVEDQNREAVLGNLVEDVASRDYSMTAGDIGFRFLLLALAQGGRADVLYEMINDYEYPGYGYQLKQGATAMTEAWDASRTHSNNHFMLGHVTEWFYGYLVGISPEAESPGFKTVRIHPQPVGDITWAEGSHESLHGTVKVRWERSEAAFRLTCRIPANTRAKVVLPVAEGAGVSESGKPLDRVAGLEVVREEAGELVLEVGSGDYSFVVEQP